MLHLDAIASVSEFDYLVNLGDLARFRRITPGGDVSVEGSSGLAESIADLELPTPAESGSQEKSRETNARWAGVLVVAASAFFFANILPGALPLGFFSSTFAGVASYVTGQFVFGFLEAHRHIWDLFGWADRHRRDAILNPLLRTLGPALEEDAKKKFLSDPQHYVHFLFNGAIGKSQGAMHDVVDHAASALATFRFTQITVVISAAWFLAAIFVATFVDESRFWLALAGGAVLLIAGSLSTLANNRLRHWTEKEVAWIERYYPRQLLDLARQALISFESVATTRDLENVVSTAVAISEPFPIPDLRSLAEPSSIKRLREPRLTHSIEEVRIPEGGVVRLSSPGHAEFVIARALLAARQQVRFWHPVSLPDAWIFHLVPGFILARERGVTIEFLVREHERGGDSEAIRLLRGLGCAVRSATELREVSTRFSGVAVDPGEASALLVTLLHTPLAGEVGWMVEGARAAGIVSELMHGRVSEIEHDGGSASVQAPAALQLTSMPESVLVNRLRRVPEYRQCDISVERVDVVGETRPMSLRVKSSTEIQVSYLEHLYKKAGLALFSPAKLSLVDDLFSPVIPPVLEYDAGGFLRVHEGHTRLYNRFHLAKDHGMDPHIRAVIIRGCDPPPQQRSPFKWEDVDVVDDLESDHEYIHTHNLESLVRCKIDASGRNRFDFMTTTELHMGG